MGLKRRVNRKTVSGYLGDLHGDPMQFSRAEKFEIVALSVRIRLTFAAHSYRNHVINPLLLVPVQHG